MRIGIDMDGTICRSSIIPYKLRTKLGVLVDIMELYRRPMPGAIDAVRELWSKGHQIIIISARWTLPSVTAKWLVEHNIPFSRVYHIWNGTKADLMDKVDVMVDDYRVKSEKWLPFTNWSDVLLRLYELEKEVECGNQRH